ncbi:ectoine synthase [Mesorhizobium sp. M0244]|uniref:ectoine synthase n=1 Tax=Mesorhizobium sp. M0244 TaxID=2956926 RepID=UPI00333637D3
MIVRDFNEEKLTAGRVQTTSWESGRMLLKNDGMGISLGSIRTPGLKMHFRNHLGAIYCISGTGSI